METQEKTTITVENTIDAPINKVWEYWTTPAHITHWNYAIDTWHCPWAKNDLRPGGSFSARMEAKDGTMGFDFGGIYDVVRPFEYIEYTIGDGRKVNVRFSAEENGTHVVESFEAENMNPIEMQRGGWQTILDNFKKYIEAN
jgi:uncharacterized protein YndB with AHSA1/START domain